jgi:hypothetical protein
MKSQSSEETKEEERKRGGGEMKMIVAARVHKTKFLFYKKITNCSMIHIPNIP